MKAFHWSKLADVKAAGTIWLDPSFKEATINIQDVEQLFGAKQSTPRANADTALDASGARGANHTPKHVQLIDVKRSNNVAIALARLRKTNEEIKASLTDPDAHPLTNEQVAALILIAPTAEEVEMVAEYTGDREALGKVELFFLALSEIQNVQPKLNALQVTQLFHAQALALNEELVSLKDACQQVQTSQALKHLLQLVLALGNHLNGTSNRGGAYGFKLNDLAKLVQVKSTDASTTLLHYTAKLMHAEADDAHNLQALSQQLSQVETVRNFDLREKRADISKLETNYTLVQAQANKQPEEPFARKLSHFCAQNQTRIDQLHQVYNQAQAQVKQLAAWLGQAHNASPADLFAPIFDAIKALEKAHKDNAREISEAQKRARAQEARKTSNRTRANPDNTLMQEMQRKIALKPTQHTNNANTNTQLGPRLAQEAASGALFAARRMSRASLNANKTKHSLSSPNTHTHTTPVPIGNQI